MNRTLVRWLSAVALLATPALSAQAADLVVSAAASLTNAFRELGPMFEAAHPGTSVVFNFAASDALLTQIAKGAPVDVFASADQEAMDKAEAQRVILPGSRRDFVRNSLVMITPRDSRLGLRSPADLGQPSVVRVAIGNPATVPAGRYARAALQAMNLWATVEPKVVSAQSVRQALDYVARGEVEAGFVYATDAAILNNRVQSVATVATEKPVTYPAAAVAGSSHPESALEFVQYLRTSAAQTVLMHHGFSPP